jgi:hypothetical protein
VKPQLLTNAQLFVVYRVLRQQHGTALSRVLEEMIAKEKDPVRLLVLTSYRSQRMDIDAARTSLLRASGSWGAENLIHDL